MNQFIKISIIKIVLCYLLIPVFFAGAFDKEIKMNNIKFILANNIDAVKILKTEDDFILSLSDFDRSARLQTDKNINTDEFLDFISKQVLAWDQYDIEKLEKITSSISDKTKIYNLHLPKKIYLIKTTGKEEGDADYCRNNSIIISENTLKNDLAVIEKVIIHELFHIISRNNEELRIKLYEIISFKKCEELEFPKELVNLKITNPDAPKNNYFIELNYGSNKINIIPILFAIEKYNKLKGGVFFNYLQFGLLVVDINEKQAKPVYKNNRLFLLSPNEVPEYLKKIGYNTNYIISPEEILADNFEIMINKREYKSEFVIKNIKELFKK